MKKLAALLLVLAMVILSFAACGTDESLIKAAEYLQSMYADDDGSVTASDYEVVGVVTTDGITYPVTWSTDNDAIKVVPNEETNMVLIDVDERSTTEVAYTLTATLTNEDGDTASCSFAHTVPKFELLTIAEANALEKGSSVTISGTVVSIDTPWSDEYNNITVTIKDEAGDKIQLYRLATKVELGDVLIVKGTTDEYNGKKQIAQGATAEITGHVDVTINYVEKTITEALSTADESPVAVTGVVTEIAEPWNTSYKNISVYIQDETGAKIYVYRLATDVTVGDIVTVKGVIATYKENKQIASGTAVLSGHYTEKTITEAAAADADALVAVIGNVKAIDAETGVITLTDDANNTILVTISTTLAVGDDVTVYGKIGTVGEGEAATTQIVSGFALPYQAYAEVTIAEALAADKNTKVLITGTVSYIKSAWSTKYNNMDIYIVDAEGNSIQVFRLSNQVAFGDNVTIKGKVDEYNGVKQIGQGSTATINSSNPDWKPVYNEMTLTQAKEAIPGTGAIISGVVVEINEAWSEKYNNITVTITDGTTTLKIYRLATNVALNDEIVVTGSVGVDEIGAGATAVIKGQHTCSYTTLANKCDVCGKISEHTCVDTAEPVDGNCDLCGEKIPTAGDPVLAGTLSFASKDNRTAFSSDSQTWVQNGITFINEKGSSSSDIADYASPVRCYKNSSVTINYANMTSIVITANNASYATTLASSTIEGATITADGAVVTITFNEAVDTVTFTLSGGQVRINSIDVYAIVEA